MEIVEGGCTWQKMDRSLAERLHKERHLCVFYIDGHTDEGRYIKGLVMGTVDFDLDIDVDTAEHEEYIPYKYAYVLSSITTP